MSDNCFVYVIHSTSGHFKIGFSTNPKRRLRQLKRTQGPFEYRLVAYIKLPTVADAKQVEKDLHDAFERKQVNGEWFELEPAHLIAIGVCFEQLSHMHAATVTAQSTSDAFLSGVDVGKRLSEYRELSY